jgi:predicted lipoprotein with Yx(FWY)xxD motif
MTHQTDSSPVDVSKGMKRIVFAVLLAGLAGASIAGGAVLPTVKTASVASLGKVVVSSTGRTLYHYTDETQGKVDCSGGCAQLWPPLVVKAGAKPVAGAGITASKLGVRKRPDGTMQVTYGGLGLYMYSGDRKSGDAKGEGIESAWYAVSPTAKIVKPQAAASSSAGSGYGSGGSMTSTSSGSGSSDSGYGY